MEPEKQTKKKSRKKSKKRKFSEPIEEIIDPTVEEKNGKKEKKEEPQKETPTTSAPTEDRVEQVDENISPAVEQNKKKRKKRKEKKLPAEESEPKGRLWTVSVALPGEIVHNAQSPELRTYLAGQIARAVTIFNVDEVIVFSEKGERRSVDGEFRGATKKGDPCVFLARVLQYLETPQYLRKSLFPVHKDLKYAGLLNPIDAPHHVRATVDVPYREGVVVDRPVKKGCGSWVEIGLRKAATIKHLLKPGTRVTVKVTNPKGSASTFRKNLKGDAVAPSEPREKIGQYWGYTVRMAKALGDVWKDSPYKGGYDLVVGTSERGIDIQSSPPEGTSLELPPFKHMLLVFGGLGGLEDCLLGDESLAVSNPKDLFDLYINACSKQGSATIRTEEAIPVTLSALHAHILKNKYPS